MQRRNAFTLIELLVSISIISVLIGIVVPAFSTARQRALRTTCQTRLHEIGRALWEYSVANDSRVPYVFSPMTNGNGTTPGFGDGHSMDDEINPYDRERWPISVQNILMPLYLGQDPKIFTCPAAIVGWPRGGGGYQMTYRDAGANQPNGFLPKAPPSQFDYFREAFGFLDGRPMNEMRYRSSGDLMRDAMTINASRGTYLRDMVMRESETVIGPHNGGINVINREFGIEYRDRKTIQEDLAPFGKGVRF